MNPYARLSDEELLAQCRVETRRGTGPGGQHRNKVESAVRMVHDPTGIIAIASERRSQHDNRRLALERLRDKIEKRFARQAPRVPTRKKRGVRAREVDAKRLAGAKKKLRQARPDED